MDLAPWTVFAMEAPIQFWAICCYYPGLAYWQAFVFAMVALDAVRAAVEECFRQAELLHDVLHRTLAPERTTTRPLPSYATTGIRDDPSYRTPRL